MHLGVSGVSVKEHVEWEVNQGQEHVKVEVTVQGVALKPVNVIRTSLASLLVVSINET